MQVSDASWFVLLSILLAIAGASIGLHLTMQIGTAAGLRRRLLLAGAAFSLAAGIWVMHFTALLAAHGPAAGYLVLPTLLSFLVGVLVAGGAIYALSAGPFAPARLAVAAGLLAAALVIMHTIGMAAFNHDAGDPRFGAVEVAIALAGSALTFWLAAGRAGSPLPAAAVFGLAAAAMHYVATVGAAPGAPAVTSGLAMSGDVLIILIAIVGFCLSGLFLLLLMPDRPQSAPETAKAARAVRPESVPEQVPLAASLAPSGGDAMLRRGIYAPLGGIGAPPARVAEHLPVERDGSTQFLPVDEVVAVQANAHYTFLFNGSAKLFCPLAIGEVESRLDRGRFLRVHRSHIINIERVTGYRRSGDSETVELAGDGQYTVPVSRSRAGWLKSRIGEKNGGSKTGEPPLSDTAS